MGGWGFGFCPRKGGNVGGVKQGCDKVRSHTAALVEVGRGEAATESLGRRLGSWGTRGGGQRSKVQSKDLVSLENRQSVSQQTLTKYPEE